MNRNGLNSCRAAREWQRALVLAGALTVLVTQAWGDDGNINVSSLTSAADAVSIMSVPNSNDLLLLDFVQYPAGNSLLVAGYLGSTRRAVNAVDLSPIGAKWTDSIRPTSTLGRRLAGLLDSQKAELGFPAWSPDGKWLAFILKRGDNHRLWVASVTGSDERMVADLEVNLLLRGQKSSDLAQVAYDTVPYHWSPDSSRLVFAQRVARTESVIERIDRLLHPRILDTEGTEATDRIYSSSFANAAQSILKSTLVAADVTGRSAAEPLGGAAQYVHLEILPNSKMLIGLFEQSGEKSESRYYVLAPSDLHKPDWEKAHKPLPADHFTRIVSEGVPKPVVLWQTEGKGCEVDNEISSAIVACIPASLRWTGTTSTYLLSGLPSGHTRVFDKRTGRFEKELEWPDQVEGTRASFYPVFNASSNSIQATDLGQDHVIYAMLIYENGGTRVRRLLSVDLTSGDREILLDDPDNEHGISRASPIIADRYILLDRALTRGRFVYSAFDLDSKVIRDLAPSLENSLSYEDFEYDELTYKRADGVDLRGRLYWPAGRSGSGENKLPLVVWQYPLHSPGGAKDYLYDKSRETYGKGNRLTYLGDWFPLTLLKSGYAVFHYPTFPYIGEDTDDGFGTFRSQLMANAEAAVKAAIQTGGIDDKRIAIAGHSRGGGDAALLLAYTDLFRTGVAIAGAMNHMSMPHDLQYETRSFWESSGPYIRNSASAHVQSIDEPVLMIHGDNDESYARPGVALSLFYGLQAVGGNGRLVTIPFMDHEPRTLRERDITVREVLDWLNIHLN